MIGHDATASSDSRGRSSGNSTRGSNDSKYSKYTYHDKNTAEYEIKYEIKYKIKHEIKHEVKKEVMQCANKNI